MAELKFEFDWKQNTQEVELLSPEGETVVATVANAFDLTRLNGYKIKPAQTEEKPAPVDAASIPGLAQAAGEPAPAPEPEAVSEPESDEATTEDAADAEAEKPKRGRGRAKA